MTASPSAVSVPCSTSPGEAMSPKPVPRVPASSRRSSVAPSLRCATSSLRHRRRLPEAVGEVLVAHRDEHAAPGDPLLEGRPLLVREVALACHRCSSRRSSAVREPVPTRPTSQPLTTPLRCSSMRLAVAPPSRHATAGPTVCNRYTGLYTADGETLELGALATTRKACRRRRRTSIERFSPTRAVAGGASTTPSPCSSTRTT